MQGVQTEGNPFDPQRWNQLLYNGDLALFWIIYQSIAKNQTRPTGIKAHQVYKTLLVRIIVSYDPFNCFSIHLDLFLFG